MQRKTKLQRPWSTDFRTGNQLRADTSEAHGQAAAEALVGLRSSDSRGRKAHRCRCGERTRRTSRLVHFCPSARHFSAHSLSDKVRALKRLNKEKCFTTSPRNNLTASNYVAGTQPTAALCPQVWYRILRSGRRLEERGELITFGDYCIVWGRVGGENTAGEKTVRIREEETSRATTDKKA